MSKNTENGKNKENTKNNAKKNTKRLVFSALMVAMSIVIGIVCKAYLTLSPVMRITFDNMPIILLGFMFGPVYSIMAAVAGDIISALVAGYAPTPLITVGAAAIGLVAGVLPKYIIKRKGFFASLGVTLSAHIIGSVIIKTYALADLYSLEFLPTLLLRAPLYIAISLAEAYLIYIILKNKQIIGLTEDRK